MALAQQRLRLASGLQGQRVSSVTAGTQRNISKRRVECAVGQKDNTYDKEWKKVSFCNGSLLFQPGCALCHYSACQS